MNSYGTVIKWTVLIVVALASLGGAFVGGMRWERGQQAIGQVAGLSAQVDALKSQAKQAATDFSAAAQRMDEISSKYQEQQDASAHYYLGLSDRWDAYWRDRPQRLDCLLDAAGIELWNAANRGAGAVTGDAVLDQSGPAAVDTPAASAVGGRYPGDGAQPHEGDGALRQPDRTL